jgi:hypothetical protein
MFGVWQRPVHGYLPNQRMKRLLLLVMGLTAVAAVAAKILLRSRVDEDLDEADLAVVLTGTVYRPTAQPFIGATVLVVAGAADIDLTQVEPAPTGVELALSMFGGSLRVTVPGPWNVAVDLNQRGSAVQYPQDVTPDAPWLRVIGRAWGSAIQIARA